MKNDVKKITGIVIVALIIIIVDQLTKLLFANQNMDIISNILSFHYIKNMGVAFGIGKNFTPIIIIANILIIIVTIAFIKIKWKELDNISFISLSFIIAGGISNLIDRIFRGYVIDFINVKFIDFPTFNIADIFVVIGIIIIFITYLYKIIKLEK